MFLLTFKNVNINQKNKPFIVSKFLRIKALVILSIFTFKRISSI